MAERIDKREVYDRFANVTKQTQELLDSMEQLKLDMTEILEENAELSVENEHLHTVIKEFKGENNEEDGLSMPRQNLQKIYEQGFHVCNEYYGKRLDYNESCTFCLDVIFGRQ